MKRILLTGARAPVTLDLVRHFHRAGHEVYLADSISLPLARLSRFAKKFFVVPKPVVNPTLFVQSLASISERYNIDIVVPTCEEIFYIADKLDLFPRSVRVFCEPLSELSILHNKWTFAQQVDSLGSPVRSPETHLVSSEGELAIWIAGGQTDRWVFKPIFSRFAARTLISPSPDRLRAIRPSESDPWVAQQRIHGQEFSTYSIAQEGDLRAHSCYRSKYRAGPGSGIYFLAVEDARIRDFVSAFVKHRNFTGQIGFDLMQDSGGHLYVLECNPRATSGLHMLDSLPLADAFFEVNGRLLEPISTCPAMLASVMFLFPFPEAIRNGRIGALLSDMWSARDVMFAWNDPLPFLLSPVSLVEVMVTAIRTRKRLTQAATFDIEWNGEAL